MILSNIPIMFRVQDVRQVWTTISNKYCLTINYVPRIVGKNGYHNLSLPLHDHKSYTCTCEQNNVTMF